jgi:hypothetical protein
MKKIIHGVTNNTPMSQTMQKGLSILFLLIATIMIFIPYSKELIFGFKVELRIIPSFISTLISILIIAPLYTRNILKWNKSIYTLISFIFFLLIFSSLVELALGGNGLKSGIIEMIFVIAIVLSWLGISVIAGICWIFLFVAVAFSIITNNSVMGFYGFIYVASSFIGLVLHSELNPGNFVSGFKDEFVIAEGIRNIAKKDIDETGNMINKII